MCPSGAVEERGGEDIRHEDPEEAPHRGHQTAGTHPLRETYHERGTLRLHRQVGSIVSNLCSTCFCGDRMLAKQIVCSLINRCGQHAKYYVRVIKVIQTEMELNSGHIFIHVPICFAANLFVDFVFCNKRIHCV